jgi:hypothetical protein
MFLIVVLGCVAMVGRNAIANADISDCQNIYLGEVDGNSLPEII